MLAVVLAAFLSTPADAAELAGVTLPDQVTIAGKPVALNGLGLREKLFIDIYVGGLYLTHPTHDAKAAIAADEPKRVVMHFVYSVTRKQMVDTFMEGFGASPDVASQKANIDKLLEWVPADGIAKGEEMTFDYAPGVGTTMIVKGKAVGTIPGADFMRMVFGIYLGPKPPTEDLKRGLLGT